MFSILSIIPYSIYYYKNKYIFIVIYTIIVIMDKCKEIDRTRIYPADI